MNRRLLSLFTLFASLASAGTVQYLVTVDTTGIAGATPGIIELQFDQANAATSLSALATITDVNATGYVNDNSASSSSAGVTGSLGTPPLIIANDGSGTNYSDQGISVFGTAFSFIVTFTGNAVGGSAADGSGFYLFLLDRSFNPLAGPLSSGEIANVIVNGDGSTAANGSTFSGGSASVALATATPEPATWYTGAGCAGLGFVLLLRRRAALKLV